MDFAELLKKLNEAWEATPEAERAALIPKVKDAALPIHQAIFNSGHAAATAKAKTDKTSLEGKVQELTTQLETTQGELKTLRDNGPGDVKKIREDFEREIARLKAEAKTQQDTLNSTLQTERLDRFVTDFENRLVLAGMNPKAAKLEAREKRGRMRLPDGKLEVLQAEGSEVPLAPAGDTSALDLLVKESIKGADPLFLTSTADGGSGERKGSGGGAANVVDAAIDRFRKDAESRPNPLAVPKPVASSAGGAPAPAAT